MCDSCAERFPDLIDEDHRVIRGQKLDPASPRRTVVRMNSGQLSVLQSEFNKKKVWSQSKIESLAA